MPTPGEHKTVQARIIAYAQQIGWTYVTRAEAERRRGFDQDGATPQDRARTASPDFGDLLHLQVRAFNPKYKEAEGALIGEWQRLRADITGNREFLATLRNQGKFFDRDENRELDLTVIDYGDLDRDCRTSHATRESPNAAANCSVHRMASSNCRIGTNPASLISGASDTST